MYRRVVWSHRQVRAFIGAVQSGGADWRRELLLVLDALPQHLAAEEAPAGFCEVVRDRLGAAIASGILREHEEFRGTIERLSALVEADAAELEAETRAFAERLGRHEQREAELALACERAARR